MAAGGEDGSISICNAFTGRLVERIERAHSDWVSGIVFLRDGTGVVSSSFDGTIKIWRWGRYDYGASVFEGQGAGGRERGAQSVGLGAVCAKVLEDDAVSLFISEMSISRGFRGRSDSDRRIDFPRDKLLH